MFEVLTVAVPPIYGKARDHPNRHEARLEDGEVGVHANEDRAAQET